MMVLTRPFVLKSEKLKSPQVVQVEDPKWPMQGINYHK